MSRTWLYVLFLSVVVGASGVAAATPPDLEASLALFSGGGDVMIPYSDEGRAQLEMAIAAFRSAIGVPEGLDETDEAKVASVAVDPGKKDLVNKLSQSYYTLGDVFLRTGKEAETTYVKGKQWALASLRLDPAFVTLEKDKGFAAAVAAETDAAALYWACGNWLRVAEFDKLGAVFAGAPAKCEAMAKRTLEIDGGYICYGPYRTLGAYFGGLPALFGQDLGLALAFFCEVVSEPSFCVGCTSCPIDPSSSEYFENRLLFVEFYLLEKGLWQDAARVLHSILDEPIGTKYPLYNAVCQEKARTFLAEVEKHL